MMEHEQRLKLFLFHRHPNRYQNNNRVLHLYRRGRLFLLVLPALSVLLVLPGLALRLYHLFRFDPPGLPALLALYHLLHLLDLSDRWGLLILSDQWGLLLQWGLLVLWVQWGLLLLYRL
jgi:hypothetical protein